MKVTELALPGVLLFEPELYGDERSSFVETWQQQRYAALGLPEFVQDNLVRSSANVLRGMHWQRQYPQAKLIQVLTGKVQDIVACIDPDSPHYLSHCVIDLDSHSAHQLFVPAGYAHGYRVLSDTAVVSYKCSAYYQPDDQAGARWDDPALQLPWRDCKDLILNTRDREWPLL